MGVQDDFEYIDALVAKCLSNEASEAEKQWLEQWAQQTPANRAYLNDAQKLMEQSTAVRNSKVVDVDAAWNKLNARLDAEAKVIPLAKKRPLWQMAAAVALLITVGYLLRLVLVKEEVPATYYSAQQKAHEEVLPDGSKLFLNKQSSVRFYVGKDGSRRAELKGEAYFTVLHDAQHPFVVEVEQVLIKDIGTAFNVNAPEGSNQIIVSVDEGEVELSTANSEALRLVKGEKAVYLKNTGEFKKETLVPADNTGSYKTRLFEFKETPMREVLAQINEVYGCDLQLSNPQLGECKLSVVFHNEELNTLVTVIAETMGWSLEQKGNTMLLKGKSCVESVE